MKLNAELTKRENEVAELLAWGAAKKEVADRLFISTRTVENTARNIYGEIREACMCCIHVIGSERDCRLIRGSEWKQAVQLIWNGNRKKCKCRRTDIACWLGRCTRSEHGKRK